MTIQSDIKVESIFSIDAISVGLDQVQRQLAWYVAAGIYCVVKEQSFLRWIFLQLSFSKTLYLMLVYLATEMRDQAQHAFGSSSWG